MKTLSRLFSGCILLVSFAFALAATPMVQKEKKPWKEWSQKEAEKILNNSPWAQIQTDTDTSELFFQPTSDPRTTGNPPNANSRLEQGATNQATNVKYGIRFFSARPVRQAFVRMMMFQNKDLPPEAIARMTEFAEVQATGSIIIAVTFEGTDKRSLTKVMEIFNGSVTGALKNTTYLERNDGKRLFLEEYLPPGKDGFGARFIFLRMVDERPFLTPEVHEVRFVSELGRTIKLNMRFKVANMMLDGELEY